MSWHQVDESDHRSFNMSDGTSFMCTVILLNFCKSVKVKQYRIKHIFHFLFKKLISWIFSLLVISRCCQYWRLQRTKW